MCLAHNALGSTGFELVLKTLPLRCLTHLDLSAVCRSAADFLPLQRLGYALSQVSHVNRVGVGVFLTRFCPAHQEPFFVCFF